MHVVNTDALTHRKKDPEKCLHEAKWEKKKTYLEACLQQRRLFSSFVTYVDGLLGVEATATLKRLASRLATKWKQFYSKTCGYVKRTIEITLVRATHRCIRHRCIQGSWVPAHRISVQRPQWEYGAGLNLFRLACQGSPNQPTSLDTSFPRIHLPITVTHQERGGETTTQGRRGFREGGTEYTCPPLIKIHINSNINLVN